MPDPQHTGRLWSPDFPFKPARAPVFYGWVMVVAGTIGMVFSIPGQTMGFSVFTDFLIADLRLSRDALSTAYCIGTVMSGLTLPMLGRAFDRLGARRMVVYSSVATGLILFYLAGSKVLLSSLSSALPMISPTWLAFGIITLGFYMIRASAQGVLTMTSRNAMGKWFDYHRGTALALSGVAVSFAFSAAPRLLDALVARHGAHGTWLLLGVLTCTLMAGLGWLLFRDNPEECGLLMDGDSEGRKPRKAHADSITHRDFTRAEALRTAPFWAFNLSFAFFSVFSTAFTFHIVSIGAEAGRGRSEVIALFLPMAAVSVCSNLFCGWASPKVRLKWLLVMMNLAALTGVIGTLNLASEPGKLAFVIGNGVCGGCFAALTGIVWPRFFGRASLGAISGVGMSSMVIASGIGPILFSLSLSHGGSYAPALWASAAVPALLALFALRADNPQRHHAP